MGGYGDIDHPAAVGDDWAKNTSTGLRLTPTTNHLRTKMGVPFIVRNISG